MKKKEKKDIILDELNYRLKLFKENNDLTYTDIGNATGVSGESVQGYIKRNQKPNWTFIPRLWKAFPDKLDIKWFLLGVKSNEVDRDEELQIFNESDLPEYLSTEKYNSEYLLKALQIKVKNLETTQKELKNSNLDLNERINTLSSKLEEKFNN